jgi:pimeloyl-ACP methyl ester carboxylesterase
MSKRLTPIALLSIMALVLSACAVEPTPTPLPPPTVTLLPTPTAATNISALYDAGESGLKLFIDCQGSSAPGTPTVILDAGLGVDSGTWARVQPQASEFARICRYDRAGLGQSVLHGPLPRTSAQMVKELHALLASAGIKPPYVLVGASFGGLNVQLYTITYPAEVSGLVLVDSLHAHFDERIEKLFTPEQVAERRAELSDNPEGVAFTDILTSEMQLANAGTLPDMPLVVLRHGRPFDFSPGWPSDDVEKLWLELQTELAAQSSTGHLVLAERAGHRISEMRPDLVIQAIKDVVTEAGSR